VAAPESSPTGEWGSSHSERALSVGLMAAAPSGVVPGPSGSQG